MIPTSLFQLVEDYKLPLFLSLIGLVFLIGGIFVSTPKSSPANYPEESLVTSPKQVVIDLSGAVKTPGVYKLNEGSRIEDLINSSGGFLENANKEYIKKSLNMAQKLIDGTKIYIPYEEEELSKLSSPGQVAGTTATKVNINTASQVDLEALSGIGPVTASKIISNRPYQETGELLSKKVIGKAVYEKIKDSLVVY